MKVNFKSGFFSIIGKPNVGKSTLINYFIGEKISIVSQKKQTTRNNIKGILTTKEYQIIFIDTPGFHKAQNSIGKKMNQSVSKATIDVEGVIFLMQANKEISNKEIEMIERFNKGRIPFFIVLTKIDLVTNIDVLNKISQIKKYKNVQAIVPISVKKKKGIDFLLSEIKKKLVLNEKFFPDNIIIDQNIEFQLGEIIREKILKLVHEEIPHHITTFIEKINYQKNSDKYKINGVILIEKMGYKRIIIGKNGTLISKIIENATFEMNKLLKKRVTLKIFIKHKKNWETSQEFLKTYGYE